MPLNTTAVEQSYLGVSAGVPIAGIPIAVDSVAHVKVYYGALRTLAVQGTDYTVVIAGDFNSLTITPTASLITKIGAGTNIIYVRRTIPLTTTFGETDATYKKRIADEVRQMIMRIQEFAYDFAAGAGSITNDKLAQMPAGTVKANTTGALANAADVTLAALKTAMTFVKADVGLGNVDNTSDANKPLSSAATTALAGKSNTGHTHTPSEVGLGNVDNTSDATKNAATATLTNKTLASPAFSGTPTGLTKTHVGLANVDNTADASKPVSTAQQTALDLKANIASPTFTGTPAAPTAAGGTNTTQLATTAFVKAAIDVILGGVASGYDTLAELAAGKQDISAKDQANGYAGLDGSGLLNPAVLPGLAINDTFTVASQAAMLALAAQKGDMAIRTDENKTYALSTNSPGTLADWKQILTPAGGGDVYGPASSVTGRRAAFADTTGKLLSDPGAIALSELATQAAGTFVMNNTAGTAAPTAVAVATAKTALGLVKADVGLGNVDNTSNATERAAVATLTNKTLTSPVINTPTGIVKGDVGLGNVDNTSDANKPVSTAQQTALNLKANAAITITSGNGLTGGGDLSANRTLAVGAGTGIVSNADDVAVDKATSANIYAGASNKVVTADGIVASLAEVALTASATPAWDWQGGINRGYTSAQNFVLQNPTNVQEGTWREILFTMGGTHTIGFGTNFHGAGGALPSAPASGATMRLGFKARSTTYIEVYEMGKTYS